MWAHKETRDISSLAAAAGVFSGPPAGALIMAASSEPTLPFSLSSSAPYLSLMHPLLHWVGVLGPTDHLHVVCSCDWF
jgi:hypothetical protein